MSSGFGAKTQLSVPTISASLEETPSLTSCGPIRWSLSAASFNTIPSLYRRTNSCASFMIVGLVGVAHLRWPDMEVLLGDPAQEVKRLQRCINDLMGLLTLPA